MKKDMRETVQAIFKSRKLQGKVPGAYLDFNCDLIMAQLSSEMALVNRDVYPEVSSSEIHERLRSGMPAIDVSKITFHEELLHQSANTIVGIFKNYQSITESEETTLKKQFRENHILSESCKNLLSGNIEFFSHLAQKIGVGQESLLILAENLTIPILSECAARLQLHIGEGGTDSKGCPACGSYPHIGMIEKEKGQRHLECPMCHTRWVFKRLVCPFCLATGKHVIKFFYLEDEPIYQVEVCDNCKKYIKLLDERKYDMPYEPVLFAENLAALHLEQLAEKQGYRK